MSVRRCFVVVFTVAATVLPSGVVRAETRPVSIGNYYYEDDTTNDRSKIVAQQGDQVAFTVREGVYPPHTVEIDELNIHSGDLLLGETYTTPALNRPGDFLVYCRPHRERGHMTRLIVRSATPATAAPAATSAPAATTQGADASAAPSAIPSPTATLAPVGVTKASEEELERPVAVDPDSVEGLTGRKRSNAPWTRALWLLLIGSVPVVAAAVFAMSRELRRPAAVTGTRPSSSGRPRSTARSPRSSGQKASGSARKSRGRQR